MSLLTKIVITDSGTSVSGLVSRFSKIGSDHQQTTLLMNYLMSLQSRARNGSYTLQFLNGDGVAASGTVTLSTVSAADTVTVGNIVFTAVSGTPSGNQFKVGVSNTADGLSLATAINAATGLTGEVTAANLSGVVTLTSVSTGPHGNLIQLSSSNSGRLAVVGFSGGTNDSASTNTFHLGL